MFTLQIACNIVCVLQIQLCFPEEAEVYDYRLDDAGISNLEDDHEDEERKVNYASSYRFF